MFRDILIALKFSPSGLHAFDRAVRLAQSHKAQLHVFHALDYHLKGMDRDDPKRIEAQKNVDRLIETNLHPRLADMKNVSLTFLPADPALETCRMAIKVNADLIVVGCHHTNRCLNMGRVDYIGMTILEKAPCAVMLIPLVETAEHKRASITEKKLNFTSDLVQHLRE